MILFAKIEMEDGAYADSEGKRYSVVALKRIRNGQGINVGYKKYADLRTALEDWGLTPIPLPHVEE